MRDGFHNITAGWMLISGVDDLHDRIDEVSRWLYAGNAPLQDDEKATLVFMIQSLFARTEGPMNSGPLIPEEDI